MTERGLTVAKLAEGCGLSPASIRWQMGASEPVIRSTWKIEKFLGVAIWTDQKHFENLRLASDFLGVDFVLTKFHPLRAAAVAKGIRYTRAITHKEALLKHILTHLSSIQTTSTS
jgi:transcriptional regulator with XRE-family HTH domain